MLQGISSVSIDMKETWRLICFNRRDVGRVGTSTFGSLLHRTASLHYAAENLGEFKGTTGASLFKSWVDAFLKGEEWNYVLDFGWS